jgi:hypothetical protein
MQLSSVTIYPSTHHMLLAIMTRISTINSSHDVSPTNSFPNAATTHVQGLCNHLHKLNYAGYREIQSLATIVS